MTGITKTRAFAVLLLLLSTALMGLEARPLSIIETGNSGSGGAVQVVGFFDWLGLGAIKDSGPRPGHKFSNSDTLGGIKDSGPSPGGKGHEFTNSNTLGGIKDSGPSSGGEGHRFTNSNTLGGIKDSGPTPGQGH